MGSKLGIKHDVRQKGDYHYEPDKQRYAEYVFKPFFFVRFKIKRDGGRITYALSHCKVLLNRYRNFVKFL